MCKWAKVREPDEKYETYQLPLYMDEKSWSAFQESGCQIKVKEDDDGKYVTFKRRIREWDGKENGPPDVLLFNSETNIYDTWPVGLIGNGSIVTVRVDVYDSRNGKGHRMDRIGIDKLVEYGGNTAADQLNMPF